MAASTRPLTLGEILDRTVQLYRRGFPIFAGIAVLPSAIVVLISGAFSIYSSSLLPGMKQAGPDALKGALLVMAVFVIFGLVGFPILIAIYAVTQSALTFVALGLAAGKTVTIRAACGFGFRFFWRNVSILFLQAVFAGLIPVAAFSIVLSILAVAAIGIAASTAKSFAVLGVVLYVAFVLAMVGVVFWIWVRLALAFAASVAEGKGAWDSIKRSNRLSKGTRGRIFVMYLLVVVLSMIVNYVLILPLDLALGLNFKKLIETLSAGGSIPVLIQVVNLAVGFLVRAFILPVPAIALVLFYNDQRTRNEGYDIDLLMAQAGWSQSPPPAPFAQAPPAPLAADLIQMDPIRMESPPPETPPEDPGA